MKFWAIFDPYRMLACQEISFQTIWEHCHTKQYVNCCYLELYLFSIPLYEGFYIYSTSKSKKHTNVKKENTGGIKIIQEPEKGFGP